MSSTLVIWPIIKALCVASQFLSIDPSAWMAVNATQTHFLQHHFSKRTELSKFANDELKAWASWDADELNAILKKEGFAIKLEPFDSKTFGVVSILDLMVEWQYKGEKSTIESNATNYPGVYMKKGFQTFDSSAHAEPIICITTKSGDKVYMTVADSSVENFELLTLIKHIKAQMHQNYIYDFIEFPMIDLDQTADIAWLLGMELTKNWYISQALQQTKLKMNEVGAHVKSAVAIAVTLKCCPRPSEGIIINKPFYLWIERPGLTEPLFAGYITQENWKDPQGLDL